MATYYIAAAGSISNTGLSANSPWPFSQAGSFSFSAGDQILFNKGDTFTGHFTISHSGSSGNPNQSISILLVPARLPHGLK